MVKILVTGANGFIGRQLCRQMLVEGWHVRGAVRSPAKKTELPAGVEEVEIESIGSETDWSAALSNIDTVIHLAARVHVLKERRFDPLTLYRCVNVMGTEQLARMAASNGVNRFIYMSSIKVNGEGRPTAYSEKDIPAPEDHYGLSKWEAEQILSKISAASEMDVTVFRAPLVYGPGVKANFLRLLKTVQKGIPLPLANVNNQRSLIYLENLVDVIITSIKSSKPASGTYLVSDGEDVSTSELIRRIAGALGKSPRMFPFPIYLMRLAGKLTGKTDAVNRLLRSLTIDNSKTQRELGWNAPYTMKQGLLETANWYKTKGMKL